MIWEQLELPFGDDEEDEDSVTEFARDAPPPVTLPQTAFVVVIDAAGDVEAYADPAKLPPRTQRSASLGDIRRGCNEIVTEINLQAGARITAEAIAPGKDTTVRDSLRVALQNRGITLRK